MYSCILNSPPYEFEGEITVTNQYPPGWVESVYQNNTSDYTITIATGFHFTTAPNVFLSIGNGYVHQMFFGTSYVTTSSVEVIAFDVGGAPDGSYPINVMLHGV